ncbi:MAG: DUF3853 family protein [Bacteroidales bacterium]|nr:DUF3853 family protein [Bacteroidales bacterium]
MARRKIEVNVTNGKFPRLLYGLKGVATLFNVSSSTALKMSKGVIKDACKRQGGIILVDTRKALELFGFENPDDFIE